MGVLPDQLPGYLPLANGANAGAGMGCKLPTTAGKDYEAMPDGGVRELYVMGLIPRATPRRSNWPKSKRSIPGRAGSVPDGDVETRVGGAASGRLYREGWHVHQYGTRRAGGASRDDGTAGARPDWQILARWPTRLAWTGAMVRRRKFWRRSGASCRCMRGLRAMVWGRKARAGHSARAPSTRMANRRWWVAPISPGRWWSTEWRAAPRAVSQWPRVAMGSRADV